MERSTWATDFDAAVAAAERLRAAGRSGRLAPVEVRRGLRDLLVIDHAGRAWSPDPAGSGWRRHDGDAWQPAPLPFPEPLLHLARARAELDEALSVGRLDRPAHRRGLRDLFAVAPDGSAWSADRADAGWRRHTGRGWEPARAEAFAGRSLPAPGTRLRVGHPWAWQLALLLGLAALLAAKALSGTLIFYVTERSTPLVLLSVPGLLLLALGAWLGRATPHGHHHDHDHGCDHAHDHNHDHDHDPAVRSSGRHRDHDAGHAGDRGNGPACDRSEPDRARPAAVGGQSPPGPRHARGGPRHVHGRGLLGHGAALGGLVLAAPLLLGWLVPPSALGAGAVGNRAVNALAAGPPALAGDRRAEVADLAASARFDLLDWAIVLAGETDEAGLTGRAVAVTGFVFHDRRRPRVDPASAGGGEDRLFAVMRFVITHCTADASVVGLSVLDPGGLGPALAEDRWVEVRGTLEPVTVAGRRQLVVRAERVTPIEPPANPYLYP